MVKRLTAVAVSVMVVVLILSTGACSQVPAPGQTPTPSPGQASGNSPINPTWTPPPKMEPSLLPSVTEVVAKAKPSVVAINVKVVTYDIFNRPTQVEGAGSGWIIDKDGYIVTNNHVVEGADTLDLICEEWNGVAPETDAC